MFIYYRTIVDFTYLRNTVTYIWNKVLNAKIEYFKGIFLQKFNLFVDIFTKTVIVSIASFMLCSFTSMNTYDLFDCQTYEFFSYMPIPYAIVDVYLYTFLMPISVQWSSQTYLFINIYDYLNISCLAIIYAFAKVHKHLSDMCKYFNLTTIFVHIHDHLLVFNFTAIFVFSHLYL